MRTTGKIVSVLLSGLMAVSGSLICASAENKTSQRGSLWADGNPNIKSADKNALDAVKWFSSEDIEKNMTELNESGNHFYLLMPSTADLNNLTLWHTFSSDPQIGGTAIKSGQSTSAIKGTGDYKMTVGSDNYTLTVMQSKEIGSMYINTESGNMNFIHSQKGNKEGGSILVVDSEGNQSYNGALSSIKGRGNTTWTNMEKKPYNIKLDKKAGLLGMDQSKKWCLLANAQDHTLLRNKIAYDLGDEIGLAYSPDSHFVDLYLNGDYAGVYQVSEKVEQGNNNLVKTNDLEGQTEKLNDKDLDKYPQKKTSSMKYYEIPENPEDITGGYLMEFDIRDKYDPEPSGFVTSRGQCVVVKGPEYASKEQVQYISKFVQEMEDALYSNTGTNAQGKHFTEYIDLESAALMYLLEEFSMDIDVGITSCFFYKESNVTGDGKIHAGPVWDFDVAFGNLTNHKDGATMTETNKWFAAKSNRYDGGQTIFKSLYQKPEFIEAVKAQYTSKFRPAIDVLKSDTAVSSDHIKSLPAYREILSSSVEMNFVRWNIKKNRLVDAEGDTYDSHFKYMTNFIMNRATFFETGIPAIKVHDPSNLSFVVYFKNDLNWENVNVYWWNGVAQTDWPGRPMTLVSDNVYKFDFGSLGQKDDGNIQIIFNNGYGKGRQTTNISPSDGMLYTPNQNYDRTKTDDEATKYYYSCKETVYTENKPDPDPKPEPTYTKLLGDVDDDNNITSADSLIILRASVGLEKLDDDHIFRADVDGDKNITSADSLLVLRSSIKIPTQYDIGKAVS